MLHFGFEKNFERFLFIVHYDGVAGLFQVVLAEVMHTAFPINLGVISHCFLYFVQLIVWFVIDHECELLSFTVKAYLKGHAHLGLPDRERALVGILAQILVTSLHLGPLLELVVDFDIDLILFLLYVYDKPNNYAER